MTAVVAKQAFVRELLGRSDYAIIGEIVSPGARVLDLGCGEGELLHWLAANKNVDARGVEIAGEKVRRAIARGVSVFQGDIDEGLADYPDHAFDYVILSQTLQETRQPRRVLREMLRVGRRGIVAFPNFGHWRCRWYLATKGRMPVSDFLPYTWYNTPNIHFCTFEDFEALCSEREAKVINRLAVDQQHRHGWASKLWPNLLGEIGIYRVSSPGLTDHQIAV